MKLSYRNSKNAEAVARFWGKSLDKPDWYKVQALSDDEAEIMIYDVIGWPFIDADSFIRALNDIKAGTITIRLNTPGGDVFDGTAIYNALKNHSAKIITRIEGLAASMGSVLAMAGKEVQAYSNTMMMIHDPWVLAMGNQYDLRDLADILEKMSGNLMEIYHSKSRLGKREITQMMKDETWLTAEEAKDKGFVNTILEAGKPVKAQFDLSIFANAPDGISAEPAGRELSEREIERALRDAGASRSFAKAFVSQNRDTLREVELTGSLENLIKTLGGN